MENEREALIELLKTAKYGTRKHKLEDAQTPDAIADIADSLLERGVTLKKQLTHTADEELIRTLRAYADYDCATCNKQQEHCDGLDCKVMLARRTLAYIEGVQTEAVTKFRDTLNTIINNINEYINDTL